MHSIVISSLKISIYYILNCNLGLHSTSSIIFLFISQFNHSTNILKMHIKCYCQKSSPILYKQLIYPIPITYLQNIPITYSLRSILHKFVQCLYLFQSSIMCGLFGSKNNIVVHNPMLVVTIPGHKLSSHLFLLPNANRIETMCFQQIARQNWRWAENNFHWITQNMQFLFKIKYFFF